MILCNLLNITAINITDISINTTDRGITEIDTDDMDYRY